MLAHLFIKPNILNSFNEKKYHDISIANAIKKKTRRKNNL